MNFNLFLIILIALIIILCIILYNGLRVLLIVEKEKSTFKYQLKVSILKIPIFKRESSESKNGEEDQDEDDEEDEDLESEDEKGLREKYAEIKPIINKLISSKEELKDFLKHVLKSIDLKKLQGNLIIGLSDPTITLKIACWIWSIGALVNNADPTMLSVEPKFTKEITDFEGKIELKINLLLLLIYAFILLTKRNIIALIKEIYIYYKDEEDEHEEEDETKTSFKEEINAIN